MLILFISLSLLFSACSVENTDYNPVITGKRYFLQEWPDSLYTHSLDSIIKLEPIKKNADSSGKTEIFLKSFEIPTTVMQPTPRHTVNKKNPGKTQKPELPSTESFPNRFMQALEKWQSDPSNQSLYFNAVVQENEDLLQLMGRAYGTNTNILPRFYTYSAIQSVNPGISVEKIKAGDSVRLPRLK